MDYQQALSHSFDIGVIETDNLTDYEKLDAILDYFLKFQNYKGCFSDLLVFKMDLIMLDLILQKLVKDGLLIRIEDGKVFWLTNYRLTFEGIEAIKEGMYSERVRKKKNAEILAIQQIESVIDTNKSIKNTNKILKLTSIATSIIVLIGCIFSYLSYIKVNETTIKLDSFQYQELLKKQDLKPKISK